MLRLRVPPNPTDLAEAPAADATTIVKTALEKRQGSSRASPTCRRELVAIAQSSESEEVHHQRGVELQGNRLFPASVPLVISSVPQSRQATAGPTSCTVCAVTETPEWRKGPAGMRTLCNGCGLLAAKRQKERSSFNGRAFPSTVEEIIYELEQIGRERFKSSAKGRYHLPPGTIQRVIDIMDASMATAQAAERMAATASSSSTARRPRSRSNRSNSSETEAAGALFNMARRASTGTAVPPYGGHATALAPRTAPSMGRGRRSGSFGADRTGPQPKLVSPSRGLPPSSSYMLPQGGVGPTSTFSFGTSSTSVTIPVACISPHRLLSTVTLPPLPAPLPSPSLSNQGSFFRPPSPPLRPISALAASTDRMSIQHLVTPDPPTPAIPSPPRFEMPPPVRLGPVSAVRGRSSTVGSAFAEDSRHFLASDALASRRPTV